MKKYALVGGLTAALLIPAFAVSQNYQDNNASTGVYIGGNYGGYKARGGDFEDENDLYEVLLGWQISPYLGVEANYTDFGDYGDRFASAEVDGVGAAIVGTFPISDNFGLYAKGGQFWWDGDVKVAGFREDFDDDSLYYGIGAKLLMTNALHLTAEYKRYDIEFDGSEFPLPPRDDETDLDTLTVGMRYTF